MIPCAVNKVNKRAVLDTAEDSSSDYTAICTRSHSALFKLDCVTQTVKLCETQRLCETKQRKHRTQNTKKLKTENIEHEKKENRTQRTLKRNKKTQN